MDKKLISIHNSFEQIDTPKKLNDMDKKLISLHNSFEQIETLKKYNHIVKNENMDIAPAKICTEPVKTPEEAIAVQTLALKIKIGKIGLNVHNKALWQHYWLKCCLSEKCDYVFSILSAECINISREEDLLKIITGNVVTNCLSTEAKKYYLAVCINFLLKRYNWIEACKLFKKHHKMIHWNLFELLLPRMLSAILVGIILIVSSGDLMKFSDGILNSSYFYYFLIFTFLLSFFYFFFECSKIVRGSLPKNHFNSEIIRRIVPILLWGFCWSIIFSYIFLYVYNSVNSLSYSTLNWKTILFYASFSFFIGILIQLLWEEKTVPEPL